MENKTVMVTPEQAELLEKEGIEYTYYDIDALLNDEETVEIEFENEKDRIAALKVLNPR